MEQPNMSVLTNERAGDAPAPATVLKRLIVGGLFAFALVVLTGCVTILPQWQATREISRQDTNQPITDTTPIIVQSGNERFILFIGATTDGDDELFLQRMNAAGQLVGSPAQLTSNSGADDQPRMVEQDGWLYVVWRFGLTPSWNYQVWWARVSTATLAYAAGPVQVSASGDSTTPDLAVRSNGTSVVVWANSNPTSTIYYRQVVSDGTFLSAPVIVSQGAGCAGAQYSQFSPRVTRSFPSGSYAQIAWIGDNGPGSDSVYWRDFYNSLSAASSNCLVLSDSVDYPGSEIDLDMAINPANNHSYVAWTHQNQSTNDWDVYYRRVNFTPAPCQILNLSNAITTTSEGGVRIAAGHTVSNWVHLVWERYDQTAGQGAIRYALVQDDDCSATPARITPSGNVALSVSPVPAGADVDLPRIAVARNAVIARANGGGGGGSLMMALDAEQTALLEAALPEAAPPAEGVFDERPALRPAADMDGEARESENTGQPAPPPDCAADPKHPRCVEIAMMEASQFSTMSAQAASAASSFQCGSNAADAVVVSFFEDTNKQMYAALFQAGEVLNGSSCARVVSAMYPSAGGLRLQALLRTDYSAPNFVDRKDHFPFISARGLPTVAWRGREPGSGLPFLSIANDEIYVAEAKFPAYMPITRRP